MVIFASPLFAKTEASGMILAKARIVKDNRVETFHVGFSDTSTDTLTSAVDILEGQIGAVLSIRRDHDDVLLYKSMFEAWDLGVES